MPGVAKVAKPRNLRQLTPDIHARQLFRSVFFVGTEPQQYMDIYKYKWRFKKLVEDLEPDGVLEKLLLDGNYVYLFGQTEPMMDKDYHGLLVPVIIALVASKPLNLQIFCKSVQSVTTKEHSLAHFNLTLQHHLLKSVLVDPANSGKRGRFPRRQLNITVLHSSRTRRFKEMSDKELINDFTYGLLFADTKFAAEQLLRSVREPVNVKVLVKYAGQEQNIAFDVSGDLRYQSKVCLLKYFLEKERFNSLDIDKETVDEALIQDVVRQIEDERDKEVKRYEENRERYREFLKQVEANNVQTQIFKYYGTTEDVDYKASKTHYVNRYLGRADVCE